jgi:hypothetical protein
MKTPWDKYLTVEKGNFEISPDSIPLFTTIETVARINLFGALPQPFLAHHIRYQIAGRFDTQMWFEINDRQYGNWRVYGETGIIPINPPLFMTSEAQCFLVIQSSRETSASVSIDGERIRKF